MVPGLKSKVVKAYLLSDAARASLPVRQDGNDVLVKVPATPPCKLASVVVLEIEGKPDVVGVSH